MKRTIRSSRIHFRWLALTVLILLLIPLCALAEGYPESEHPYASGSDITWTYTHSRMSYALKVTFSDDTEVESRYDFIYLTDSAGTTTRYTGTELRSKSVYLLGNNFSIRLTSDSSVNKNGFTITNIISASEDEYQEYQEYLQTPRYTINTSGVITAYSSQRQKLIIPNKINGITVTGIGPSAFSGNAYLTDVILPDTVVSFGGSAFRDCTALTNISIPDGVTSIGDWAFRGCSSLTSIEIPNGVTSIGELVFYKCGSLTSIKIPDGITSIGTAAIPANAILIFGRSEVIERYALDNGLQYICDGKSVTHDGITTVDDKISWVVGNYTNSGMSEYQKALRLFDWLCANVAYDYSSIDTGIPTSPLGVSGEAALMDGTAVCIGYAEAYMWLLEEVGIEAKYVIGHGTGESHAWNIAKINGAWYHFDATWDEAGNGRYHDFFGLSDMAIHTETVNHGIQDNYRHLTCDSWEANYHYKNGYLNAALNSLRDSINASILAGTYSGTAALDNSVSISGTYSRYTIALILNNDSDWDVAGRVEVTPINNKNYSFVFKPGEEVVTDIIVEGLNEQTSNWRSFNMYLGYAAQLNVSSRPQGQAVAFTSSNENVITVTKDGLVTAVAAGNADIVLKSGAYSRIFSIHVVNDTWLLGRNIYYLDIDETVQIDSYIGNWFLTDSAAIWTSADKTVATVDRNGFITSVGNGRTTITLKTAAGTTNSVTVYVHKPVTAVVFERGVHEAYVGQELTLHLHPEGCDQDYFKETFSIFTYSSSDDTIATYNGYYYPRWNEELNYWVYRPEVKCLAPGGITFTAMTRDGSKTSGSCQIIVHSGSPFMLPAALKAIESEAFLSFAAVEIVLPEGVKSIGSRAFAQCGSLRLINLPASLISIADDAFESSENVTLICSANSEGLRFAEKSEIPYVIKR